MWSPDAMTETPRPIVAAYDGSPAAGAALRAAADLFADRTIVVVSIWESGASMLAITAPDPSGLTYIPPRPEDVTMIDEVGHDHASALAEAGAAVVRRHGGVARARPGRDELDGSATLMAIAGEGGAAAIVGGPRGLSGPRAAVLGSAPRQPPPAPPP